jgi:amino acid transporter
MMLLFFLMVVFGGIALRKTGLWQQEVIGGIRVRHIALVPIYLVVLVTTGPIGAFILFLILDGVPWLLKR